MSSKSRKQSDSSRARRPGSDPAARGAMPPAAPKSKVLSEEFLVAPKSVSRTRYALMIGLVIFLLIIFIVPGAMMNCAGGSQQQSTDEVAMRWRMPDGEEVVVTPYDFAQSTRLFAEVFRLDRTFIGINFGLMSPQDMTAETVASLMLLDELAKRAGVIISDDELRRQIKPIADGFRSAGKDYPSEMRRYGGAPAFEQTMRRVLRCLRYLVILGDVTALPDPTLVEEGWNEDHRETRYDYASVDAATLHDAVRADAPEREDLIAWFDGLDESRRNIYREPERRRVGLAVYRDPETTPATGLLEKYPEAEEASAEERAGEYYDRIFFDRFPRPEGEEPAEPETDESGAIVPPPQYLTRDEVADQCLVEAPIYFAMDRWLRDLQQRVADGEEVDFATEAAAMGLSFEAPEAPLTMPELADEPKIGGFQVAGRAFNTPEGDFTTSLVRKPELFGILRVDEVVEPAIPPFDVIYDQVLDEWVADTARERAYEQMKAIYEGFGEVTAELDEDAPEGTEPRRYRAADDEAFRLAVETAGLELKERPFLDRAGDASADPMMDDPAHSFIRSRVEGSRLETEEVAEIELSEGQDVVYLVRLAEWRAIPLDHMTPAQYGWYMDRTASTAPYVFRREFSFEYMKAHFGLLLGDEANVNPEGEGEPEDADETETPDEE